MTEVARANEERVSEQSTGESPPPTDNGWRRAYWRRNLRLMVILLSIWFIVAFGGGILFIEQLNEIVINGFPLGFWIAQQGSIYTFVLLILAYAVLMDRLDRRFGVDERDHQRDHDEGGQS